MLKSCRATQKASGCWLSCSAFIFYRFFSCCKNCYALFYKIFYAGEDCPSLSFFASQSKKQVWDGGRLSDFWTGQSHYNNMLYREPRHLKMSPLYSILLMAHLYGHTQQAYPYFVHCKIFIFYAVAVAPLKGSHTPTTFTAQHLHICVIFAYYDD